ncbi:MAG: ABC transporter ATP-binding protein [Peptostreptococcaceae bacterium]|nr:ABC transporter ATP-binding protein [Peptostreptococcaceae bacterium]
MLIVKDLNVHYGGIHALKGATIHVPEGKIVTLIGANGAGKSTTLRSIMRIVKSSSGDITYNGESILSKKTTAVVKSGVVLVPEGRRIFPNLTVKENLILGAYLRNDKAAVNKDMAWVYDLFPILKEREWQPAGTLSGGEQQMLAVGRGLMTKPKLMMMDEPSLGLAPLIVKDIFSIIREIHKLGVTILLVEQNAKAALEIADYGYVLETGRIVLEGPGKELLVNEEVKNAYLGEAKE